MPIACTMSLLRRLGEATERFMRQSDAPLVLGLAVVTLTLVFTTSRYLLYKHPEAFPLHVPDAINIALMATASLAIAGLLAWFCGATENGNNESRCAVLRALKLCTCCKSLFKRGMTRHDALERCERVAAVIFVAGAAAFHVLRLMADFDCWGEWHACRELSIARFHQVGAIRGVCQLVFMVLEFAFCLCFRLGNRRVNAWMLLGLGLVQCANFAMWFDALLDESEILPPAHNSTLELEKCHAFFDMSTHNTSKYVKCFKKHTKRYEDLEHKSPYLYPLNTEFLLLAAKIVFDFLFARSTTTTAGGHGAAAGAQTDGVDNQTPDGTTDGVQDTDDEFFDDDEVHGRHGVDDPLLQQHQIEDRALRVGENAEDRRPTCFCFRPLVLQLTMFEILCGVVTLTSNALFLYFGSKAFYTEDKDDYWRDTFARYRDVFWTVTILVSVVGYRIVPSAEMRPRRLERFEYFVVLCSVGLFAHNMFTLIANVQTSNETCPTLLFLCEEILNILQVLSQTAFYVYAAKVREAIGRQATVKGAVYRAILFHFWVTNLVLWGEDSFVETHNKDRFFQNKYYEHWTVIYNITNPVMICYRLNCMFLFASLYFSDRPEHDDGGHVRGDEDAH